jgi:hypothetical protein
LRRSRYRPESVAGGWLRGSPGVRRRPGQLVRRRAA